MIVSMALYSYVANASKNQADLSSNVFFLFVATISFPLYICLSHGLNCWESICFWPRNMIHKCSLWGRCWHRHMLEPLNIGSSCLHMGDSLSGWSSWSTGVYLMNLENLVIGVSIYWYKPHWMRTLGGLLSSSICLEDLKSVEYWVS